MNGKEQVIEISNEFEKTRANLTLIGDIITMGTIFIRDKLTNTRLEKDLVQKALIYLQKRHPYLNAYLDVHKKENKIFLRIPKEYQCDNIFFVWLDFTNQSFDRNKIIAECAKFNSILFNSNSLLWRVQVIEYVENGQFKYALNYAVNIMISDGLNCCALCIEMINIINSLIEGNECDEMKIKLEPLDRMNKLCDKIFKESYYEAINEINKKELVKFLLPKEFGSDLKGYNLDFFSLDENLTNRIIKKCKLNGIRFTGYFLTILLYSLRRLYLENGLDFPTRVSLGISISLRVRYVPVANFSDCGFHITANSFSIAEEKFGKFVNVWNDAKYVHDEIQANLSVENGSLFSQIYNNESKRIFNEIFSQHQEEESCELLNKLKVSDLIFSNLGTFVNERVKETDGKFTIDEMYISDSLQSKPSVASALLIHVLNWKGQTMVQLGSNNSDFTFDYLIRYKQLIIEEINKSLS